jgi:hypothetical protein
MGAQRSRKEGKLDAMARWPYANSLGEVAPNVTNVWYVPKAEPRGSAVSGELCARHMIYMVLPALLIIVNPEFNFKVVFKAGCAQENL